MSAYPESQNIETIMADAPFNDPQADVILRSNDGVEFRVFKIVLSLASPIFADMFSIPSPPPSATSETFHDGLPVVPLSEDSKVVDLALRHCYPIRSPKLVGLKDALGLLEFQRKYQVDPLGPLLVDYLKGATEHHPVSAYCLAIKYQYEDIARAAARSCLKLPITELKCDILHCITVEEYQALIEYHSLCGVAAGAVTLKRDWFPSDNKLVLIERVKQVSDLPCAECIVEDILNDTTSSRNQRRAPRCLWSYLHRSSLLLVHHPSVGAIKERSFVLKNMKCNACSKKFQRGMLDFSSLFATEVKKAIEKVPLSGTGPKQ
jgi:BTB/POZ domain